MQEDPTNQAPAPFSPPNEAYLPISELEDRYKQNNDSITWTASEFIAHHKSSKWYMMLGLTALGIAFLVWLLTKDVISAAVVLVGAGVLGAYGARQPRELTYQLDIEQLLIQNKAYDLNEFRSFSVDDQQAFANINLMPLKRFSPGLTIYCSPDDEGRIIDLLSARLPMEAHHSDLLDKLMHRIRF